MGLEKERSGMSLMVIDEEFRVKFESYCLPLTACNNTPVRRLAVSVRTTHVIEGDRRRSNTDILNLRLRRSKRLYRA